MTYCRTHPPVLCICMSMHLHVQTQSHCKQFWKYLYLWGENQIHCKNRKDFSSVAKNKMVNAFWKDCVRSTLTAGNSLTSCLSTATSALLRNKKDLSKKQGVLLVAAIQWFTQQTSSVWQKRTRVWFWEKTWSKWILITLPHCLISFPIFKTTITPFIRV